MWQPGSGVNNCFKLSGSTTWDSAKSACLAGIGNGLANFRTWNDMARVGNALSLQNIEAWVSIEITYPSSDTTW